MHWDPFHTDTDKNIDVIRSSRSREYSPSCCFSAFNKSKSSQYKKSQYLSELRLRMPERTYSLRPVLLVADKELGQYASHDNQNGTEVVHAMPPMCLRYGFLFHFFFGLYPLNLSFLPMRPSKKKISGPREPSPVPTLCSSVRVARLLSVSTSIASLIHALANVS